jgi:exodeoxyribonuclease-5
MRQKGIAEASTIHSLIYKPVDPPLDRIKELRERLAKTTDTPANRSIIHKMQEELEQLSMPGFVLNEASALAEARLLVLDEVSMVDADLAFDLLSFGKPTLVVGDPGQLPPPTDAERGFFDGIDTDILLETIHRQDSGSPIIEYATDVRLGRELGSYGDGVKLRDWSEVLTRLDETKLYTKLLEADQVITGMNKTRWSLNRKLLAAAGFTGHYPIGEGEKLICLKNHHELGIVNGMPIALTDVEDPGPELRYFKANLLAADKNGEPTEKRGKVLVYKGHFDVAVDGNKNRLRFDHPDWQARKMCIEADWGYAITAHKAQGSEWRNVMVIDDGFGMWRDGPEVRKRWLYTAATRASEKLTVIAKGRHETGRSSRRPRR